MKSVKNLGRNLPVGRNTGLKIKKGNSIRKTVKTRSTRRFFEVKIRMPMGDFTRGQPYFHEEKYLSRYMLDAYLERVNRAEANNKAARMKILAGNIELFEPVLKEMHAMGKLSFLNNEGGT